MAKITLATLKSFLKKNEGNLYIIEYFDADENELLEIL